jgi:acid stress chaperone HdeA
VTNLESGYYRLTELGRVPIATKGMLLRPMMIGFFALSAVYVGGCSDVEEAVNKGGDTPCSDYLEDDADDRRVTVTKFLKEDGNGNEPAGTAVDAAIIAIDLLCSAQQNADTPIKDADLAGILTPK